MSQNVNFRNDVRKQCGSKNVVMLRISKGVTGFFLFLEFNYKMIRQTIEHKTTKENRAPKIITSYLYLKLGVKIQNY